MYRKTHLPAWLHLLGLLLAVIVVAGCRQSTAGSLEWRQQKGVPSAIDGDDATAPAASIAGAPTSEAPPTIDVSPPTAVATVSPEPPMPTATTSPPVWPPPVTPSSRYGPAALLHNEEEAAAQLADLTAPLRDDVALARAYWAAEINDAAQLLSDPIPFTGERQLLNVLNFDSAATGAIEAELLATSEYAYFWYDTDPTANQLDPARVAEIMTGFDRVFADVTASFGLPPALAAVDGPVLHIVNASPAALCANANSCGVGGYFSAADALPLAANPTSNQRRMFVMNADHVANDSYLSTLAHELRHLIEFEYDRREADWETEGSAVLAEELAGWPVGAQASGNAFLTEPDLQLNHWSEAQSYRHYGQGYLLNRYLYDRLGAELYREFAVHPASGLAAVDALATERGLDLSGTAIWQDWLTALAIHDRDGVSERYQLGGLGINHAAMSEVAIGEPTLFDTTVNQYGADYYHIMGNGPLTVTFAGSSLVPLLDVAPLSGASFWYAGRSNFSESRLTRPVDLRHVAEATLQYTVYHDIEPQYDFAYVSVSEDGGETWQGLSAPAMQRKGPAFDPSDVSLTDRFYSGRSEGWIAEEVDLSQFAGREILLRFSYLTDSVATERGYALDNIAIPEIGFYDDAENPAEGWQAEGFLRATGYLPQTWHLQLITFADGMPQVTVLTLAEWGQLTHTLNVEGEAILIVAAAAPATLESALYQLQFDALEQP